MLCQYKYLCWSNLTTTTLLRLFLNLTRVFAQVNLSKHPIFLIVSYDGFRYDYIDKTETPNFFRVKGQGVSVPFMQNEFVTLTFPNHHSIATGLHIESHGVVANNFYDPLFGRTVSGYKDEPEFWNYSSSVLPLWVLNEISGDERFSGVMMWPGAAVPFGPNSTLATHRRGFRAEIPFERRIDEIVSWITDPEKPANLIFAYFEEPDATGHRFGPDGQEMLAQIQRIDNVTGYLLDHLESLRILEKVNLILLSDHGLSELRTDGAIDLWNMTNSSQYAVYGASPVLHVLPKNQSEILKVFNTFRTLATETGDRFEVYLKNGTEMQLKSNWHYTNCRRIMPILLVARTGFHFVLNSKPIYTRGSHGYDNDDPDMHPFFMARGPLFKVNATGLPFRNVDIYPALCQVLNLTVLPNNGTARNFLSLLLSPPKVNSTQTSPGGGVRFVGAVIGVIILGIAFGILISFAFYSQAYKSNHVVEPQVFTASSNHCYT